MRRIRGRSTVVFFLAAVVTAAAAGTASAGPLPQSGPAAKLVFAETGYTELGEWKAWGYLSPKAWEPGRILRIEVTLELTEDHLARFAQDLKVAPDAFICLATAERRFDAGGHLRLGDSERMSTLITPTGLAIEGGVQGAVTNRYGYDWRTPFDQIASVPASAAEAVSGARRARFAITGPLPAGLPPGIYRVRLDFGIVARGRLYSLNGETFAARPFVKERPVESFFYTAPIPASGPDVSGRIVDATTLAARIPWVVFGDYNSNGYRGVVADEDKPVFALSPRTLIPDDVILPLYDDAGKTIAYSLEPQFPADTIEARSNIPWDYTSGEIWGALTQPDGSVVDLGRAPITGRRGQGPTTGRPAFTSWKPPAYGAYTLRLAGWIADAWGNRYFGGGTYRFWIAKRMTLATATFQGMPYPVGGRYGRDLQFNPAVPAEVRIDAALYILSDPSNKVELVCSGRASPGGVFSAAQGLQTLPLSQPGEYAAHILATYTDADKHLWVCSMRHAGVVYPADTPVAARGKKIRIGTQFVDRGETHFEGYTVPGTDLSYLVHLNFPFQSGDVLLIASEQQAANKIEPVLTFEDRGRPFVYDPAKMTALGATNLKIATANGYSPHLFPEYITDWMYYYAGAPRPGFMSRFLVGENAVRSPYWPTSPNSFGGQIGASNNGDLPGDIYRLVGGVVVRRKGETPLYAGYLSSAFILPKGTNNNRIIAPGTEEVNGPTGGKARFFLVGLRPGMVYETGTSFLPVAQIDPVLPVDVSFTLEYPDGRRFTTQGAGDAFGSFAAPTRYTLDVPGIYRYWMTGTWNGFAGGVPGVPAEGGIFYVLEKDRPSAADLPSSLRLSLPNQSTFNAAKTLAFSGTTNAPQVSYAVIVPGCVVEEGTLPVRNGRFDFVFDPATAHARVPTYDIVNLINGKAEIGDVVHITFFARETTVTGAAVHSFARVILRGTRVFYAR